MTIPAAGFVTYILSAERSHLSAEQNGFRTLDLKRDLGRMFATGSSIASIQEVEGCYKGDTETSFAVVMPATSASLFAMMVLARSFEQESVLAVIENGQAYLHFCEHTQLENIGRYKAITKEDTAGLEAWSVVKATGEAFTFV